MAGIKGMGGARRTRTEPPEEAWFAIATDEARKLGCRPSEVMGGARYRKHVVARWRAWYALREAYPEASVAGIGRICGYDHSSVRHGLRRLAKEPMGFNPTWFPRLGPTPKDRHV